MSHNPARNLARLTAAKTRSISPENFDGSPGNGGRATEGTGLIHARDLGKPWKISPSIDIAPGAVADIALVEGPGVITHMWFTMHQDFWRQCILRAYWDKAPEPAIEVPYGDFFCHGWGAFAQVNSQMIAANPLGGFNSYWPMPFRTGAHITLENTSDRVVTVFYQITYEIDDSATEDNLGYLHAQWNRSNPLPELETHPIIGGVTGSGHFVGTYIAWGSHSSGWWGEGEVKMYLDDDDQFPTICGTGVEDYFGGAWAFEVPGKGYAEFSTPYLGMPQVLRPDGLYLSQQRFGLYRWHVADPIRFDRHLRIDVQALGWRSGERYLSLRDDIASTALFYLSRPFADRPAAPTADSMEIC